MSSHHHATAACEHAPDMMRLLDRDGRILWGNRLPADALGEPIERHVPPGCAPAVRAALDRVLFTGEPCEREARCGDALRGEAWNLIRCRPTEDGAVVAVLTDITASKRAELELTRREEQLLATQKLAPIGRLACQIAHDFNNVLTAILITAQAIELVTAEPESRADAREIIEAVSRGARLTKQLLAFSQRGIAAPVPVDVNGCLSGMRDMLERLVGQGIDLRLELGSRLGLVSIDRGRLEQVVMNLAINARDAMPEGGSLTITTHRCRAPRASVGFTVTDTGTGIDPATTARLFEPFYTTKASGEGTGLGLAIVRSIVEQAGGHVMVETEVGKGSAFTVCLRGPDRAAASDGASLRNQPESMCVHWGSGSGAEVVPEER